MFSGRAYLSILCVQLKAVAVMNFHLDLAARTHLLFASGTGMINFTVFDKTA